MVRMKEKTKKNQKIIVQTGVVIVILLTLMTIAVGNMITMSSFSTALDSNMSMFTFYLETLGDNLNEYQSLSWLMDYWKANSEALVTEEDQIKRVDNIDGILKKFSNELVYKDMHYTNGIRNGVIAMMIFIFILILLFLYFIVPRPLSTVLREDTSQDVMNKVRSAVDVFVGTAPQYDDLTMLCLVMNKKSEENTDKIGVPGNK